MKNGKRQALVAGARLPHYIGSRMHVHFTDEYVAANAARKRRPEDDTALENALLRIRGVSKVCLDHQVWLEFEPSAQTWGGLAAELARTYHKAVSATRRHFGIKESK